MSTLMASAVVSPQEAAGALWVRQRLIEQITSKIQWDEQVEPDGSVRVSARLAMDDMVSAASPMVFPREPQQAVIHPGRVTVIQNGISYSVDVTNIDISYRFASAGCPMGITMTGLVVGVALPMPATPDAVPAKITRPCPVDYSDVELPEADDEMDWG